MQYRNLILDNQNLQIGMNRITDRAVRQEIQQALQNGIQLEQDYIQNQIPNSLQLLLRWRQELQGYQTFAASLTEQDATLIGWRQLRDEVLQASQQLLLHATRLEQALRQERQRVFQ